jgi:DNA-binding response OmpR family regulator/anti-anti-sigma regulatory factor
MHEDHGRAQLLIVEDDPVSIKMLDRALTGEAFEAVFANDGEMGLSFARSEQPDLILLDVALPGIDGFEVCRRLKADPATREVPVIFMTAFDAPQHRVKAFQAGGVDYISKPFEEAELLARIWTQVSLRRLTRALRAQNASLENEIQERVAAEAQREQLREQLDRELGERLRAEVARAALQEQIIAAQRERLAELSTPLIPITERIVVMPLIGTMDAERASEVQESALRGASARRAAFVILDITGMRSADGSVAEMLVRTGDALRLLGARAVVTGVSPDVARMLVEQQVSLGSLVTKATLQDGIAYALHNASAARGRRVATLRRAGL